VSCAAPLTQGDGPLTATFAAQGLATHHYQNAACCESCSQDAHGRSNQDTVHRATTTSAGTTSDSHDRRAAGEAVARHGGQAGGTREQPHLLLPQPRVQALQIGLGQVHEQAQVVLQLRHGRGLAALARVRHIQVFQVGHHTRLPRAAQSGAQPRSDTACHVVTRHASENTRKVPLAFTPSCSPQPALGLAACAAAAGALGCGGMGAPRAWRPRRSRMVCLGAAACSGASASTSLAVRKARRSRATALRFRHSLASEAAAGASCRQNDG